MLKVVCRQAGSWPRIVRAGTLLFCVLLLSGCSARPPRNIENSCAIFDAKSGWYRDTERSRKRWGVPIPVQLAIVHQESSFVHNAKPPRKKFLWIFPGPRPSSAVGYAQATRDAWIDYIRATGRRGADRDDFGDAVDFIGWYGEQSRRKCGIAKTDAYALYLAYHEGHGGYRRKTYLAKPWLVNVARKVASRSERYQRQLTACEGRLRRRGLLRWLLWPF